MVAMGILTVAILALIGAFLSGNRLMANSANISTATEIGREFLEKTKSGGIDGTVLGTFDSFKGDPVDSGTAFPQSPYPSKKVNGTNYNLVVRCENFGIDAHLVQVQVHWSARSKVTLTTVLQ